MAFVSMTHGKWNKGRPRGHGHPAEVVCRLKRGLKTTKGETYYQDRMSVRIAETTWKAAGFDLGNRVEVLFDREKMVALIRLADGGYTLSCSNPPAASYDLKFLFPFDESMGFPAYEVLTGMNNVRVEEDGIYFDCPLPTDMKSLGLSHQGKPAKKKDK